MLWDHLFQLLSPYPDFLIIDHYEDKLGGDVTIRGWEDFTNWKHDLELQDIPFVGPRFTWTNNREGSDLILERLDRTYGSPAWLDKYPLSYVKHFPILHSDHLAIFYQTAPPYTPRRRPYQFENWCLTHSDIPSLITSVWQNPIAVSSMYCFTKHLSLLRQDIKRWCLDHKVVWGIDWKDISEQLTTYAEPIDNLQQGNAFMSQRQQLLHKKQRSTFIYLLKTAEGDWTDDVHAISTEILRHFKNAYTPSTSTEPDPAYDENIGLLLRELNLPQLSAIQQQQLLLPFSELEVHDAMFGIGNAKSPGLDSSTAEFFKTHWDLLGVPIFQAVSRFLTTGFILREWNQSLIVLLPKGPNPEKVTQFRPISLCNTIYKCASKCLVNRLRPLLQDLISEYQSAFIPGRHMDDNILISHELTHVINKHRRGNVHLSGLKLDMNKAYDRVNWVFLLSVLRAYGFPEHWLRLIQQCISIVTYRILVNGQVSEAFTPHYGLRQGDPISPYLFLFCMDILSRMLTQATDIRQFDGIKAHRYAPPISHLFFADDAVLFFKATTNSCTKVSRLLARFCMISGQMLSLTKSYVKFSPNIPQGMLTEYKSILKLEATSSMGTYLGTPVDIQRKKTQHFTYLLDKISQRITAWSHTPLSQAGKVILINSVLIASIAHILFVFLLPTTIANKVDAMVSRFFWAKPSGKGIAWRRKDILNMPKGAGGLGLRSVMVHNRALLIKKVWRIHRNSKLLVSQVFASTPLHIHSHISMLHSLKGQSSWGARSLNQAEKILLDNYAWKIGSNSTLRAGQNRWVNGQIPIYRDQITLRTATSVTVGSLILQDQQGWNIPRLHSLFTPETIGAIRGLELPSLATQCDIPYWPHTASGKYTTKSGYYFLSRQIDICSMTPPLNSKFFRILWGLRIMPKWKIFLWKLWHNSLATVANLSARGLSVPSECPCCALESETCQHLFRMCPLATTAWRTSQLGIISNSVSYVPFREWLVAWILYLYRMDGPDGDSLNVLTQQVRQQHLTFLARPMFSHTIIDEGPGPPGFLMAHFGSSFCGIPQLQIQVDGSWVSNSTLAGIAWVAENVNNQIQIGEGSCIHADSALLTEAKACLQALLWAQGQGYQKLYLHTDSEIIVLSLLKPLTSPISITWTLGDIRLIGQQFVWCRITKVARSQVQKAHDLATRVRQGHVPLLRL
ncbi:uncharacterized protein LOC104886993 [Beta vulgaris subsp. vulgaris]|uniref:uncharacterized protein LOC104886993 n=1 Tax=Beta vulgaris subsp. vulgaris TaxID=3555 RepID=UPI0025470CD0|nr:uncharacterized protein LOC104886993 [Beta vulgaris subsp. vulgaris]